MDILENSLWDKWINHRDEIAFEYLYKKYKYIITYQVSKFLRNAPEFVDSDEIKSNAIEGFLDAMYKYDVKKETKFSTYASLRVSGSIIDFVRREDPLPRGVREKIKKIQNLKREHYLLNGEELSIDEISNLLDISKEEIIRLERMELFSNKLYLENDLSKDNDYSNTNGFIKNNKDTPEKIYDKKYCIQILISEVKKLSKRDQLLLSLVYVEELKFIEVGKIFGLSTSRVSQIHKSILKRLKENILHEFLK